MSFKLSANSIKAQVKKERKRRGKQGRKTPTAKERKLTRRLWRLRQLFETSRGSRDTLSPLMRRVGFLILWLSLCTVLFPFIELFQHFSTNFLMAAVATRAVRPNSDIFLLSELSDDELEKRNSADKKNTSENNRNTQWDESTKVSLIHHYLEIKASSKVSHRKLCRQLGVPPETMRGWLKTFEIKMQYPGYLDLKLTDQERGYEIECLQFFSSSAGRYFLKKFLFTIILYLCFKAGCGACLVAEIILKLGFEKILPTSLTTLQTYISDVRKETIAYGRSEEKALIEQMKETDVALGADETFFGKKVILVVRDILSGYILQQKYAKNRECDTWHSELLKSLSGFKVRILSMATDEGKSLIALAKKLALPRFPDLFHIVQEIYRGFLVPVHRMITEANNKLFDAEKILVNLKAKQKELLSHNKTTSAKLSKLEILINTAQKTYESIKKCLEEVESKLVELHNLVADISSVYHLINLNTGSIQTGPMIRNRLQQKIDKIRAICEELGIERAEKHLAKAERTLSKIAAAADVIVDNVKAQVSLLRLTKSQKKAVLNHLLAAHYLQKISNRTGLTREQRKAYRAKAKEQEKVALSLLAKVTQDDMAAVNQCITRAIKGFNRSSSQVESCNASIARRNANARSMTPAQLELSKVVDNFLVYDQDGKTAAQRLSGYKPRNLLTVLMHNLPDPPRPNTRKRKRHEDSVSCWSFVA